MQFNIKNAETNHGITALAALLHVSKTEAVRYAVQKCLDEETKKRSRAGLAERLWALSEKTAPLFKEPWKSADHGDLLYDEMGLPR